MPDDKSDKTDVGVSPLLGADPYRTPGVPGRETTDPNKDGRNPALNLLQAHHVDDLVEALGATKRSIDKLDTTINKFIQHVVTQSADRAQYEKRREELGVEFCERLDRIEAAL